VIYIEHSIELIHIDLSSDEAMNIYNGNHVHLDHIEVF